MRAAKCPRSVLAPFGVDAQGLVLKDVEEWLEEQRHNLFTCFRCGRFGKADEFIVLDWETADGEERFIYVCRCCLAKYG